MQYLTPTLIIARNTAEPAHSGPSHSGQRREAHTSCASHTQHHQHAPGVRGCTGCISRFLAACVILLHAMSARGKARLPWSKSWRSNSSCCLRQTCSKRVRAAQPLAMSSASLSISSSFSLVKGLGMSCGSPRSDMRIGAGQGAQCRLQTDGAHRQAPSRGSSLARPAALGVTGLVPNPNLSNLRSMRRCGKAG